MFTLPGEYGKLAQEELMVTAKKLYENVVSELLLIGNTM